MLIEVAVMAAKSANYYSMFHRYMSRCDKQHEENSNEHILTAVHDI